MTITAIDPAELGLENPRAIALASITDTATRRAEAGRSLADRRTALALLRTLLVERYGTAPTLENIITADPLYADLAVLTVA